MTNELYMAGVARADITPPVGIRLIGYTVREGVSQGVDEPLTATVLVLRGGDNGPLRTLHEALTGSLLATRSITGAEPFEPHVTLMRSRKLLPAEAVAPVRWIARELVLVHSFVGQGHYEFPYRRPLGPG